MWIKISAILGVITGLCLIFFRRSHSKHIQDKQIGDLHEGKNFENLKQLKKMGLAGFLSKFVAFQVGFAGVILVLMYIPVFFPQSERSVCFVMKFLVFSYFSIAFSGLILGTLLRRILFGEIEGYMRKKRGIQVFASNGNIRNFPEVSRLDFENSKRSDDPVLKTIQKKCAIKAIVSFVVLYVIFLSSFFMLVNTVK